MSVAAVPATMEPAGTASGDAALAVAHDPRTLLLLRGPIVATLARLAWPNVLVMVALGLMRILRGPGDADRMMAAQLMGTGGMGTLLLFAVATGASAAIDVALVLALLSVFASVAFVKGAPGAEEPDQKEQE